MKRKKKFSQMNHPAKSETSITMARDELKEIIVEAIMEVENRKQKNGKPLTNITFFRLLFSNRKTVKDTSATTELVRSILGAWMSILGFISFALAIVFFCGIYIFLVSHAWLMLIISFIFVIFLFIFSCLCRVSAIEINTTNNWQFLFEMSSLLVSFFAMVIASISLYVTIRK